MPYTSHKPETDTLAEVTAESSCQVMECTPIPVLVCWSVKPLQESVTATLPERLSKSTVILEKLFRCSSRVSDLVALMDTEAELLTRQHLAIGP